MNTATKKIRKPRKKLSEAEKRERKEKREKLNFSIKAKEIFSLSGFKYIKTENIHFKLNDIRTTELDNIFVFEISLL